MTGFEWRAFLARWSKEWLQIKEYRAIVAPEAARAGWLGYAGAAELQIQQLEARLGVVLAPSYRAFLRVSNGWRDTSPFVSHVWSAEQVEWLSVRNQDLIDIWTADAMPDSWEKRNLPAVLEISDWGDSALYLLNPQVVRSDGEWEACFFANWAPGARVYGSFQELLEAEYESFQRLCAQGLA